MSGRLEWTRVPVEPEVLGGSGHPFKGLMLAALTDTSGSGGFTYTEADLADTPVLILRDSPVVTYLRGATATLPQRVPGLPQSDEWRADLREQVEQFLADVERLGEVRLVVTF